MNFVYALLLMVCLMLFGCREAPVETAKPHNTSNPVSPNENKPVVLQDNYSSLENVNAFSPFLVNGSAPESEEEFQTLEKMGIKTIISVESGSPKLDLAKKYGMKYVHIPIGYSGVPEKKGNMIAKAVQELPGPTYIHCYHGKHRSPAAAAFAQVVLGECTVDEAIDKMKEIGVSEKYPGLYSTVEFTAKKGLEGLKKLKADFPEVAKTSSLDETMANIGRHWGNLKLLQKNNWEHRPDHPDLVARRETEIVSDLFEYLSRNKKIRDEHAKEFNEYLDRAAKASLTLKLIFNTMQKGNPEQLMTSLASSCKDCHKSYRD